MFPIAHGFIGNGFRTSGPSIPKQQELKNFIRCLYIYIYRVFFKFLSSRRVLKSRRRCVGWTQRWGSLGHALPEKNF